MKDFKQLLLSQFETDVAMSLIEFGKSIRKIDADVLIFMARKSLCIYDILLRLGLPPAEQYVVSDRVLDLKLDGLKGKKVALIDDTLIVGTTLAKTRKFLNEHGIDSVQVHTFCIDDKWWSRDLIDPDSVTLHLPDARVMTFCTAAVRAISLLPRPYLVDFPLSRPLKIPADEAQCFLSNIEWRAYNISTYLQRTNDISALSFFPNVEAREELKSLIGADVDGLLDIVKVRGFARKQRDVYWLQLVPIVVLKPLADSDLESTLRGCLERGKGVSEAAVRHILDYACTPRAHQRLLQYLLSCIVGRQFANRMKLSVGRQLRFGIDMQETDRHFGPWLHDYMKQLTECDSIAGNTSPSEPRPGDVRPAMLPLKVQDWAKSSLPPVLSNGHPRKPNLFQSEEIKNLIPDFSGIFLSHYDSRELPARKDALRRGVEVLKTSDVLSNRNRLEMGLPWSVVTDRLLSIHNIRRTPEIEQAFSLALDFCNDQGIAVAVTCLVDGVVFRAYRHGEDVKFTDAEVALAFEAAKGFMEAARVRSIPKLKLEKLLVLLIKIGVAKNFLEPLLISASGVQEVLRIGFYLRGAVPILARGPKDRADRENWFSNYLVKRGVLVQRAGNSYELGDAVEGNFRVTTAPDEAYELGHTIGILSQAKKDPNREGAPLDDNAITLIASCGTPRHAAASLQVELDLFREWFEDVGRTMLRKLQWPNRPAVKSALKKLVVSNAHVAVHGTRLKFVGYKNGEPQRIVQRCADYLLQKGGVPARRRWLSYWNAAKVLESSGEKVVFDPMLEAAARLSWEASVLLSVLETCLARYLVSSSNDPEARMYLQAALRKYDEYSRAMSSVGLAPPTNSVQVRTMMESLEATGIDDSAVILTFNHALRDISSLLARMAQQADAMSPRIEEYGRLVGRRDYQYMIYYDIVDSTGTLAGRNGVDLESYRKKVQRLKEFLNDRFRRLSQDAKKAASEVFCWNGSPTSTNDCKHVFVGGPSATELLQQVLTLLTSALEAIGSVHLRIYILPCNFAGTTAYRTEWDTEVSGERFWEHWSRLLKAGKHLEESIGPSKTFLLVAVDDLIDRIAVPDGWLWDSAHSTNIESEIELLVKTTKAKFGQLVRNRNSARSSNPGALAG